MILVLAVLAAFCCCVPLVPFVGAGWFLFKKASGGRKSGTWIVWLAPVLAVALAASFADNSASFEWIYAVVGASVLAVTYDVVAARAATSEGARQRNEKRQRELASLSLDRVDAMDGHAFEAYLCALFSQLGFRVERSKLSGACVIF